MEITLLFMGDSLLFHLQGKQDSSSNDYQLFTSYFRGEEPKKEKKEEKEEEEVTKGRKARGRQERRKHDFFLKNQQRTSQ